MPSSSINGPLWNAEADTWAALQESTARPLYDHVLAALTVAVGVEYLDLGCGSGLALSLAGARGASLHGLDAAAGLLHIARSRVPEAELVLGDLEALPFANRAFDVVTGFNSFQYASRPARAIAEAFRVTRPGGHVVVATWAPADQTQAAALLAALRPLMPPAPPDAPGPFALSDESALRSLVAEAGFIPRSIIDVDCPFVYPDTATAVRALGSSGVAQRARIHSGAEAVDCAHETALGSFVRADGTVFVPNRFRYLLAQRNREDS